MHAIVAGLGGAGLRMQDVAVIYLQIDVLAELHAHAEAGAADRNTAELAGQGVELRVAYALS